MKVERGFNLIEILLSLALLGILAIVFLSTFSSGSKVLILTDEQETAKNVAESQMEYVQKQPFASACSAAPIGADHPGYSANISPTSITSRDGTTTNGNSASNPYNCWNGESVGMTAEGTDVDTFYITWSGGLLAPGDTSAKINIWTQNDIWNLAYIIPSAASRQPVAASVIWYADRYVVKN